MDELRDLRLMVDELENNTDEDERVAILQKLGKALITEYEIKIDGIKIEPLWVEAYYYNQNKFPDCNSHLDDKQKNRFGQLYFHRKGYGGFDICLSNSDEFYLSFLLKATLIDGKFNTQTGIYNFLAANGKNQYELENKEAVMVKKDSPANYDIRYAERVGITKPCYKEKALAIFSIEALRNKNYNFTFARKVLIPLVKEEMQNYKNNSAQKLTESDYKKRCKEVFGWTPDALNRHFEEFIIICSTYPLS